MPDTASEVVYRFGPFSLYPSRHLLTAGRPVALGGRAMGLLVALVERAGQEVGRDELMALAWPSTHVADNNLRVQMTKLRDALNRGDDSQAYIATNPGRGYRFIAPVLREMVGITAGTTASPLSPAVAASPGRTPVGRAEVIVALAAKLERHRLVSIVGPGGMGKTTVALAVAASVAGRYPDGVGLIDLAAVRDGTLVPGLAAARLAPHIHADDPLPALTAFLKTRRMLVVLDSCEPVTMAAAGLAEALLAGAPGLDILVTSREPLRAEGEQVHRLGPLAVPDRADGLTAARALEHAAVRLFVDRMAASLGGFDLRDEDASLVAEICRRLDGIPLALELAAGPVEVYGIAGVVARLDDRFALLVRGRRTAADRHQTLRAAVDWSYNLLSSPERHVLDRLSVFDGGFGLTALPAVAGMMAEAMVADLVAKSLVVADLNPAGAPAGEVRYRLLDTIRAYAGERLAAAGGHAAAAQAHARHYLGLLQGALPNWDVQPVRDMLVRYGPEVDNIRQALDWCLATEGQEDAFRALTLAAAPLWMRLSLWKDCRQRAGQALALAVPFADERQHLHLTALRGMALTMTNAIDDHTVATWDAVRTMAARLGDPGSDLQALLGLWVIHFNRGHLRHTLALAHDFQAAAARNPDRVAPALAERMIGASLHILGDHEGGRIRTERALELAEMAAPPGQSIRFHLDQRILAQSTLAGILWLQGAVDHGQDHLRQSLQAADVLGHAATTCTVLGQSACAMALLTGDLTAAQRYCRLLLSLAERHGLQLWHQWGLCFDLILKVKIAGAHADTDAMLRRLADIPDLSHPRYMALVRESALALGRAGDPTTALGLIDTAFERSRRNEEGWCLPELMRLRGELLFQRGDGVEPEALYRRALALAAEQGALSWQLRAVVSLARLQIRLDRVGDAPALLADLYARFSEGRDTSDLKAAETLLLHFSGGRASGRVLDGPARSAEGGLLTA
ncbi:MAG: winged helix-turn-helix domain-containing protein [Azospirillaceae bacterium]|nr:winged helix-turn-helix domain-containing protein [Azospirillaceae bacterium]